VNVYSYQSGTSAGSPVYIPAERTTCINAPPACTPTETLYPDLKAFVTSYQSYEPFAINADARYFLYVLSDRTMMGANVYYGPNFLFDTCKGATAGCAQATYSYTVPGDGSAEDYNSSGAGWTNMSATGRYLAFRSARSDLVVGDTNHKSDVFLRDMCLGGAPAGCVPTTIRINAPAQVQGFEADAEGVRMSRDARFIYFYRHAGSYQGTLSAYDTCIGAVMPCVPGETVVNIDETGATVPFGSYAISPDGRYIAFNSGQFAQMRLLVRDTCLGATGACTPTTITVNFTVVPYSLAPGGKYIATMTTDTLGNTSDTNGDQYGGYGTDVYVIDTCLGAVTPCTQSATRISVDEQGIQVGGIYPTFTPDGSRIIYQRFLGPWVITGPLTLP
jgi:hypothetical protein